MQERTFSGKQKKPSATGVTAKPFQPAVGREFEGIEEVEAKTRDFLARMIAVATIISVGVAGLYSLMTGRYEAVAAVWSVAGPIIGAVVAYYFGPRRNDTG
jgi:hypothetical protein